MLTDELTRLHGCSGGQAAAALEDVRAAWRRAVFSEAPDHSLRRYFSYHLAGICRLADTSPELTPALLDLIRHAREQYASYLDTDLPAPQVYRQAVLRELQTGIARLLEALRQPPADAELCGHLEAYLREVTAAEPAAHYSYHALDYLYRLVSGLSGTNLSENLIEALLELNFNHLGVFRACRRLLGATDDDHLILLAYPDQPPHAYHPDWPPLSVMLRAALKEAQAGSASPAPAGKMPLNLSVAQLACWLKLFQEENLLAEPNLSAAFRFTARHYRTRRQDQISPESLSKNFYDIDQVTAATVRGQLTQMLGRLNQAFFPA